MMVEFHRGIFFALATMGLWSFPPFFFAASSRRIGPFANNVWRLLLASSIYLVLCALQWWLRPAALPRLEPALLLAASGVAGLALGDYFFYRALSTAGPERTSLVLSLAPACTAFMAWIFLRERLSPGQLGGMALVLGGVALAAWPAQRKKGARLWTGAGNGVIAAVCQGVGAVLAREAFLRANDFPPLTAAALRIVTAAVVVTLAAALSGKLGAILRRARTPGTMSRLAAGVAFGPVGGMLCFVIALRDTPAGIVTTIIFMTPLLVLPLGAWRYGTRLPARALGGGVAALAGVVLLGWRG